MDQANTTWWLAHPRATCDSTRCFLEPLSARSSSAGPKAGAGYALSTPSLSFSNRIYICLCCSFLIILFVMRKCKYAADIHPRRPPPPAQPPATNSARLAAVAANAGLALRRKAPGARRAHTTDHRPPTTPRRSSGYCPALTGCGSAGSPEHNPNRRLHYVLKKTAS